jgi:divalent metal cation (Fe/Co/Zn/Cd) transporter
MSTKGKVAHKPAHEDHSAQISRAEIVFLISEAICILFYGLFTEFNEYNTPMIKEENEKKAY